MPFIAHAEVAEGELPDGKAVVVLLAEDEYLLRFGRGHMTEQAACELSEIMQGRVDAGLWTQGWNNPQGPAPQLKAS